MKTHATYPKRFPSRTGGEENQMELIDPSSRGEQQSKCVWQVCRCVHWFGTVDKV